MAGVITLRSDAGARPVGEGGPCFVIAEAGVNHNGSVEMAQRLIEVAAQAGADAVKFQTFKPESVIVPEAPKAPYQRATTAADESQMEMLRGLQLSYDDFRALKAHADRVGITFLSTGHDEEDVDFLVDLGVPALKVASMDLVNTPLLAHVGRKGLPVLLSTGMATLGEIEAAVELLRAEGASVVLLHCVTNYPIREEEANLRVMETLRAAFDLPVGFSDHTVGINVALAATALGAVVVEKHFTLDRGLPGPDHAASLDPHAFQTMVSGIRTVERALGSPVRRPLPIELENRKAMRRSLVAAVPIQAGSVITRAHLSLKRPGTGLDARYLDVFVGRRARRPVAKDELLSLDVIAE